MDEFDFEMKNWSLGKRVMMVYFVILNWFTFLKSFFNYPLFFLKYYKSFQKEIKNYSIYSKIIVVSYGNSNKSIINNDNLIKILFFSFSFIIWNYNNYFGAEYIKSIYKTLSIASVLQERDGKRKIFLKKNVDVKVNEMSEFSECTMYFAFDP